MMIMEDSKVSKLEYDRKAILGGGGGGGGEGGIDPDAGISPCANRMGKHAFQAHFDGKIYQ